MVIRCSVGGSYGRTPVHIRVLVVVLVLCWHKYPRAVRPRPLSDGHTITCNDGDFVLLPHVGLIVFASQVYQALLLLGVSKRAPELLCVLEPSRL